MTTVVPTDQIERLVGAARQERAHLARAVGRDRVVHILHSVECKATVGDLRYCVFSMALDNGILEADWSKWEDKTVTVAWRPGDSRLVPTGVFTR